MLVTFYTDAYENITFFGDIAKQLLTMMGHSSTVPGALKAAEIPQALQTLEDELNNNLEPSKITNSNDESEQEAPIGLDKRAVPLIQLLNAAIKKDCDVMWK